MTIWILAILCLGLAALAGWRQGGIGASITFFGILVAALLAGLVGKIFSFIVPYFGVTSPITQWLVSPICGFILVVILFTVLGHNLHKKVEMFYKYKAGELRMNLWERLNTRLGICVGLLNGAVYFVLASFIFFHLAYVTTQTAVGANQPMTLRLLNSLGNAMQSSGVARAAAGVATLPPKYFMLADTAGFLAQNPEASQRIGNYPGFDSLWERDDMQPLVTDTTLTNALASGVSVGTFLGIPSVQDFLHNKTLSQSVWTTFTNNYEDFTNYLTTGKSAKYDGEKLIGQWEFNPAVSFAWLRQDHPRMSANEMRAVREWMLQSYAQTKLIVTGDNQVFIRNLPRPHAVGGPPATTPELSNWKGDWSNDGKNYTLHVTFESDEKFLTGTTEGIRLTLKDGKTTLIFDKAQ